MPIYLPIIHTSHKVPRPYSQQIGVANYHIGPNRDKVGLADGSDVVFCYIVHKLLFFVAAKYSLCWTFVYVYLFL